MENLCAQNITNPSFLLTKIIDINELVLMYLSPKLVQIHKINDASSLIDEYRNFTILPTNFSFLITKFRILNLISYNVFIFSNNILN